MSAYAVATSGLTRRFGQITAVDGLTLQVPPGGVYGFLGPNGAGKSTTIRLLLGLIRADAGEAEILGRRVDCRRPARGAFRAPLEHVGALVETPSLYPHLTGRENLEVLCRLTGTPRQRIAASLEVVDLRDVANRLVKTYSLGMRQRLGLAMALLRQPELLILDEPTNGLDPAGIHEIRDLLRSLPRRMGVTVFLSSHLLSEVEQVATHIGIIREGRLVFQGTLAELYAETGDHIVLGVDRPERAARLLHEAGWQVEALDHERVDVQASGRSDAALINAQLVRAGVNVYHLAAQRPSLEQVFLRLTGNEEMAAQAGQPLVGAVVE